MAETSTIEVDHLNKKTGKTSNLQRFIVAPEVWFADKNTSFSDPRIQKVQRHYQETYSLSDETTPEGGKIAEIARKLEDEEFRGKIKYKLVNHPTVNAFALGDTVYVYSGLVNKLKTTSEIASVLAHEITHIEKGDTAVHDSTNDPDSVSEIVAKMSIPRIREYTADAMVTEKLDRAGYNPTAYQDVLNMFHSLPDNSADFTHGFAKDRQSAQILQMKLKDYESTSRKTDEPKPSELSEAYLTPRYKEQLFDRLFVLAGKKGFESELSEELSKLSPSAILDLHGSMTHMASDLFTADMKSRKIDSGRLFQAARLMELTDAEVDKRIRHVAPELPPQEVYWERIILYTEVADRKFGELQDPAHWMERMNSLHLIPSIDYAGRLIAGFRSEDDVIRFARMVKDNELMGKMGYEPPERDFPNRIFSLFPDTWDFGSTDVFFRTTLDRLHPDLAEYSRTFDFIEKVGQTLDKELQPSSTAASWTSRLLDVTKTNVARHYREQLKEINPQLYDEDTPRAIVELAPQIKPLLIALNKEYFARAEKYWETDQRETHKKWELDMMASFLYGDLPYETKKDYEAGFVLEYMRGEDPKLDSFLKLAEAKKSTELVAFFQTNGVENFQKYARLGRMAQNNGEFTAELLRDAHVFIQKEYRPTEQDKAFVFNLLKDSRIASPKLIQWKEQYGKRKEVNYDEVLAGLGIGTSEMKLLLSMQFSRLLTIGGNEDKAYQEYNRLVNEIDISLLSPEGAMLIFNQLIDWGEGGGHGLTEWKEPHHELDWGEILLTKNLQNFRDRYFQMWAGASIYERVHAVRTLSESLTEFGNKQTREPAANWFGSNQMVATFMTPLVTEVMDDVGSMNIERSSVDDLKKLYEVVGVVDDRRLIARVRSEIELQIVKLMTYEEATEYLKDLLDKDGFPLKAIDYYQENLIRTPDQLRESKELMEDYFNKTHEDGDERITAIAGIDYTFEKLFTEHSLEIFEAALESSRNDTNLRTVLAKYWFEAYMPTMATPYRLDIPTANNGLTEVKIKGGAQHQFVPFETFVQSFYQKLGQPEVDILLRKMLISEEGVLMTSEGRQKLHALLLGQITSTDQDKPLLDIIDSVVGTGLEVVDPAKLYQPIASILRDKLFIAPSSPGSSNGAAEYVAKQYADRVKQSLSMRRDSVDKAETSYEKQKRRIEYQDFRKWVAKNTPTTEDMLRVLDFNPINTRDGISDALRAIDRAKGRIVELTDIKDREATAEQLEPVEVVLEFSRNMGAVGVRFLQLLGQYVELPDRYQAKFDEVYDQVRGQLKYTAYNTLAREATKDSALPEFKNFWGQLKSLSPTIAGGSTMTVYVATMNDGSEKIVKVLNPNAEEFVRQNIADARAVVGKMGTENPNPNYELAETLVDDLEEWLTADINMTTYEDNNKIFEEINNGFNVATSGGRTITIASPKTVRTGTKYIKIEDLVPGRNVSELLNNGGNNEAKPYVEAIISSFKHQTEVVSPVDNKARVHSDVHIGNVRLGDDGKLYWIDRGYYLEMTSKEVSMIKPLLEGKVNPLNGMQTVDYLLGLPENQETGIRVNKNQLFANLLKVTMDSRGKGLSGLATANNILLELKREGVHVPIRFSLFFKNIRAQAKMAQRVGVKYP